MRFSDIVFPLSLAVTTVSAGVVDRQSATTFQNELTASPKCTTGATACINGQLAQCVGDKFVIDKQGTSVTCGTSQDVEATGAEGGKREIENRQGDLPGFVLWARAATAPPSPEAHGRRNAVGTPGEHDWRDLKEPTSSGHNKRNAVGTPGEHDWRDLEEPTCNGLDRRNAVGTPGEHDWRDFEGSSVDFVTRKSHVSIDNAEQY